MRPSERILYETILESPVADLHLICHVWMVIEFFNVRHFSHSRELKTLHQNLELKVFIIKS